jgi:hypothetical protein
MPDRGSGGLGRFLAAVLGLSLLARLVRGLLRRGSRRASVDPQDLAAGHETGDMSTKALITFGVLLIAALGAVLFAASVVLCAFSGQPPRFVPPPAGVANAPTGPAPAEPQLETQPGQVIQPLRERQQAQITGYHWLDRGAGRVQIPIDRAMDLLAAQGLPSRPASDAQQYQDHGSTLPSDASSGRASEATSP